MRFKRSLLHFGWIIALALGVQSCSLYEGPPPPRKKEFQSLGCLKDFGARFADYFDGKGTPDDTNRLADCSISAVRAFQEVVRGETRDRFTAQEIRNFIQHYFLEDVVISDDFLKELMRVKQAFLGGKVTDFSREDLKSAEAMIETFRKIFLRLQSSMPISLDRMKLENEEYVDSTSRALADAADILGEKITELDSVYQIAELGRLLDEFSKSFPARADFTRPLRDNLKIAGRVKEVMVSPYGDRESITAKEWKLVLQDGSRWLGVFSKFLNLQSKYPDWTRGAGRPRLGLLVNETTDLLERVVARHCPVNQVVPSGCTIAPGIPIDLIQEIIGECSWDGTIGGTTFRKESIQKMLPVVIRHLLGEVDFSETGRGATRLTREHLERFRRIFREWLDGSRYVEGVFKTVTGDPKFADTSEIPAAKITNLSVRDVLRMNGGVSDEAAATAEGLRKTVKDTFALTLRDSKSIIYDGKNRTRPRGYLELARYTWLRPLLTHVVRGYVRLDRMKGTEAPQGLLLTEFTDFIADLWPILTDFHFVGPSNHPDSDAKRRMREAALFTQLSDGDNAISIDEGVQLVMMMLSADPMNREAHARIAKICPIGDIDEWGEPKVLPKCYRDHFYDFTAQNRAFQDLWAAFPVLVKFYGGLNAGQRAEFDRNVEIISRKGGYQEDTYFDSSDTQATVMLFHYVEDIFERFDMNGDGIIDKTEANAAFPVFRDTLADIAHLDPSSSNVRKVFYYLLKEGKPPVNDNMGWWKKFWHETGFIFWSSGEISASRLDLVKVFAAMVSAEEATPTASPSPEAQHSVVR